MNTAKALVACYPGPVRRRWGDELLDQIEQAGARSWPNTLFAAAGLWLRPGLWPETRPGERRRVLATFAVAVAALTLLIVRATGTPMTNVGSSSMSWTWPGLVSAGLLAAVPLPRPRTDVLPRFVGVAVRSMWVPMLACGAIVAVANSPLDRYAAGSLQPAFVTAYWLILLLGARQGCVLVGRTAGVAGPPGPQRIRVALTLIGAGLSVAVAQVLTSHATASTGASCATAALLAALVATVLVARHDVPVAM